MFISARLVNVNRFQFSLNFATIKAACPEAGRVLNLFPQTDDKVHKAIFCRGNKKFNPLFVFFRTFFEASAIAPKK
jgi:hypothetical protein